jgi:hypothetical protein
MAYFTDPVDSCGNLIPHEGCQVDVYEGKLGPGLQHAIQLKWLNAVSITFQAEVWVFVDGYKPYKLADFFDGQTYSVSWDLRKSIENGLVKIGLVFPPTELEKAQGSQGYTIVQESFEVVGQHLELTYRDLPKNSFAELDQLPPQEGAPCENAAGEYYVLGVFPCCPVTCTKPYDNTIFCWERHNESAFALKAAIDPGFAKQAFLATEAGVQPIRGIALTRSADAFDADVKLLYGSQQWVMVWDFEQGRLMDFFPKEWLRYGAAFYYQNQTLRKEIKAGFSNRKPYYLEIVDLGLVNSPQGSYNLDLDVNGQRTRNWDVPSRILALHREGQQRPVMGFGTPKPMGAEALYTEFNHVSVDAYQRISDESAPALRERFFQDRKLFLEHTTKQKHHDQVMFLTKEVAERTLRALQDTVENGRQLTDVFNPETQGGFGYYMIAILNLISQKMLRAKADAKAPTFGDFKLEIDEGTSADWLRYVYGELRRLVEITKIDKKDFQTTMFEALKSIDPADPTSLIKKMQELIDPALLKQQYEVAANGRIPAGGGLSDPDTKTENQIRGLTASKSIK